MREHDGRRPNWRAGTCTMVLWIPAAAPGRACSSWTTRRRSPRSSPATSSGRATRRTSRTTASGRSSWPIAPDRTSSCWTSCCPRIGGLEVMRRLRADRADPPAVILLTARGEESDRISGLRLGADDYVVKPFSPGELVARVDAVLRRIEPVRDGAPPIELGELVIDVGGRRVTVRRRRCRADPARVRPAAVPRAPSRTGVLARPADGRGVALLVLLGHLDRDRPRPAAAGQDRARPRAAALDRDGVGRRLPVAAMIRAIAIVAAGLAVVTLAIGLTEGGHAALVTGLAARGGRGDRARGRAARRHAPPAPGSAVAAVRVRRGDHGRTDADRGRRRGAADVRQRRGRGARVAGRRVHGPRRGRRRPGARRRRAARRRARARRARRRRRWTSRRGDHDVRPGRARAARDGGQRHDRPPRRGGARARRGGERAARARRGGLT